MIPNNLDLRLHVPPGERNMVLAHQGSVNICLALESNI